MTVDLLFNRRWPKSSMDEDIKRMDVRSYSEAYQILLDQAPKRAGDRRYLGGRTGYPSTDGKTNRREEHFAIAMVNAQQGWCLPDGTLFELLDYQVPLKATRFDREIGKIDMFGLTEHGRVVVVELKVIGHSGGPSDPPPVALLEGLRYASIVEANLERISEEVRETFGRKMVLEKPDVVILGEADWWPRWLQAGSGTKNVLEDKAIEISQALGLGIVFASVTNTQIQYGRRNAAPQFSEFPRIEYSQSLPASKVIEQAMQTDTSTEHKQMFQRTWWRYAGTLPETSLDGNDKKRRPPVVSPQNPSANLMLPSDSKAASEIEAEISTRDRHKHFRSFRSSQAMAQSVFGAFKVAGRLDLLSRVPAECGRPAFGKLMPDTVLPMEVDVKTLNEPRPTQLDVLLENSDYRVAVECKFCESGFGTCSRVNSKNFETPICNGTYTKQQQRQARWALSEIGVAYWEFIPELFDWDAARDWSPCPLQPTYQIVRNALAAVVDADGGVNPSKGHAVIVYDSRNPDYKLNGAADVQFRQAASACRVPGLIRRVAWQEVLRVCVGSTELAWMLDAMEQKHGLYPNP